MPDSAPEMDLLRAAVRAQLAPQGAATDFPARLAGVNWDHVLWLGRQEGALPFLHEALERLGLLDTCPPAVLPQLDALRQVGQLRLLGRARELCLVQALFDRHEIFALPLDSWLLARASGTAPRLTEFGASLRYIVAQSDRARAATLLHEAGHPTAADPETLIQRDRSPVLLVSRFSAADRVARLHAEARSIVVGGRRLPVLSPLHWLMERITRRGSAANPTLIWAWQIAHLAQRLDAADWSRAGAEAAALGLTARWAGLAAAAFDFLRMPRPSALAGAPLAPAAASSLSPDGVEHAPFLPTAPVVVQRMLKLAAVGPDDTVCDLGCGDGRLVVSAARDFGARGVGVDFNPVRIAAATARAAAEGVTGRVTFHTGDLYATDLTGVTVVTCYLLPQLQPRLREKLDREGRPGLRIVSHEYVFPGWPPERTEIIRPSPLKLSQIYLWRIR